MKKNIIIVLFVILLVGGLLFLFGKKGNLLGSKDNLSDTLNNGKNVVEVNTNSKNNSGEMLNDIEPDKLPKNVAKEDMPSPKKTIIEKKDVKEELTIQEKLEKVRANQELEKYLKAICGKKTNIDDITCSAGFNFFEPRLYSYLIRLQKDNNLSYQDTVNFLVSGIIRTCPQVKGENMELLIRALKENDTTCTKEVDKIYKARYKTLQEMFQNFQLTEKNFTKPINFYYSISNDLTDVKQMNLQILIFENLNKQAKQKYGSVENFKKKVMENVGADSIENLKQIILNDYENLFNKYKLKDCGLKLTGYENYFVWIPIEKKASVCLKKKIELDKDFERDYNNLVNKVSTYSYLTKNFVMEKAFIKALFGPKGVGISNLLDIYAIIKGN